jgi:hypothetical protein
MLSCIASVDGDTAFADNHVYFDEFDELLAFGKFISQPGIFGDKLLAFQRVDLPRYRSEWLGTGGQFLARQFGLTASSISPSRRRRFSTNSTRDEAALE